MKNLLVCVLGYLIFLQTSCSCDCEQSECGKSITFELRGFSSDELSTLTLYKFKKEGPTTIDSITFISDPQGFYFPGECQFHYSDSEFKTFTLSTVDEFTGEELNSYDYRLKVSQNQVFEISNVSLLYDDCSCGCFCIKQKSVMVDSNKFNLLNDDLRFAQIVKK